VQQDAQIIYLTEGSMKYGGQTWEGDKTKDKGTYMYVPPNAKVGEITSTTGAEFFIISLPMVGDIEAEIESGRGNSRAV
jgi:hypothetical protein